MGECCCMISSPDKRTTRISTATTTGLFQSQFLLEIRILQIQCVYSLYGQFLGDQRSRNTLEDRKFSDTPLLEISDRNNAGNNYRLQTLF